MQISLKGVIIMPKKEQVIEVTDVSSVEDLRKVIDGLRITVNALGKKFSISPAALRAKEKQEKMQKYDESKRLFKFTTEDVQDILDQFLDLESVYTVSNVDAETYSAYRYVLDNTDNNFLNKVKDIMGRARSDIQDLMPLAQLTSNDEVRVEMSRRKKSYWNF